MTDEPDPRVGPYQAIVAWWKEMTGDGEEARDMAGQILDALAEFSIVAEGQARIDGEVVTLPDEHVIEIKGDGSWAIEHPIRCRVGGRSLHDCPDHIAFARGLELHWDTPPPGRYTLVRDDDGELDLR